MSKIDRNAPLIVQTARALGLGLAPDYGAAPAVIWNKAEAKARAWITTQEARRAAYRISRQAFRFTPARDSWQWAADVLERAQGRALGRESSYALAGNTPEKNARDMAQFRAGLACQFERGRRGQGRGRAFDVAGRAVTWLESPGDVLRFIGDAEALNRLRYMGHRDAHGYYLDSDYMETARPVVYQLPGRDGAARYLGGMACPHNDGAALLALGDIAEARGDDHESAILEALATGHAIAESYAEAEREYNEAWRAGADFAEAQAAEKEARESFLELRQEAREAAQDIAEARPVLCKALAAQAREYLAAWQEARETKRNLWHGTGATYSARDMGKAAREAFDSGVLDNGGQLAAPAL